MQIDYVFLAEESSNTGGYCDVWFNHPLLQPKTSFAAGWSRLLSLLVWEWTFLCSLIVIYSLTWQLWCIAIISFCHFYVGLKFVLLRSHLLDCNGFSRCSGYLTLITSWFLFFQPLMLIVPDVQDVYTPLESDVIVQLSEVGVHPCFLIYLSFSMHIWTPPPLPHEKKKLQKETHLYAFNLEIN